MNTTTDPFLLYETAPARRRVGIGALLLGVVTGIGVLAVGVLTGACLIHLVGPGFALRSSPTFERLVAALCALILGLAIPLWLSARGRRALRRMNPMAHPGIAPFVLVWNVFLAAFLVFCTPDLARVSLREHGNWMLNGIEGAVPRAIDRSARWTAARIPRDTPLALTHHTTLPSWPEHPVMQRGTP